MADEYSGASLSNSVPEESESTLSFTYTVHKMTPRQKKRMDERHARYKAHMLSLAQNDEGHGCMHTPLMIACMSGDVNFVKEMIAHHADVEEKNERGFTALHIACFTGVFEIVKMLLVCGANANVTSVCGQTPMSIAIGFRYPHIVELLKQEELKNNSFASSFFQWEEDLTSEVPK